jgi:hypothetical protein
METRAAAFVRVCTLLDIDRRNNTPVDLVFYVHTAFVREYRDDHLHLAKRFNAIQAFPNRERQSHAAMRDELGTHFDAAASDVIGCAALDPTVDVHSTPPSANNKKDKNADCDERKQRDEQRQE